TVRHRSLPFAAVSDGQLKAVRGVAFVMALLVAALLQRFSPHARVQGSWRVNGPIWLLGLVAVGLVCGTCGFTAARWAQGAEVGLLNAVPLPGWAAIAAPLALLDLVSHGWRIAACCPSGGCTRCTTPTRPSRSRRACAFILASSCSRFPCGSPRSC